MHRQFALCKMRRFSTIIATIERQVDEPRRIFSSYKKTTCIVLRLPRFARDLQPTASFTAIEPLISNQ